MDLVLKLREIRRLRGLSQKDVARLSGVGEKTISSFETGERIGSMKLMQLLPLLSAYGVTPGEFFGGGVERAILAELERLSKDESALITALRRIPEGPRARLIERFLAQVEAVEAASEPRLRAV